MLFKAALGLDVELADQLAVDLGSRGILDRECAPEEDRMVRVDIRSSCRAKNRPNGLRVHAIPGRSFHRDGRHAEELLDDAGDEGKDRVLLEVVTVRNTSSSGELQERAFWFHKSRVSRFKIESRYGSRF